MQWKISEAIDNQRVSLNIFRNVKLEGLNLSSMKGICIELSFDQVLSSAILNYYFFLFFFFF